jgi:hypothetical protein
VRPVDLIADRRAGLCDHTWVRSLDRHGRRQLWLRAAAWALIVLFLIVVGPDQAEGWWSDIARPLLDLGAVLLLALPIVLPASAIAGFLRRRQTRGAPAWCAVLVLAQSAWVGWMAWFAAWAYEVREAVSAPFGIWLLCAVWAGITLAIGAVVEELVAGRPPQPR